MIDASDSGNSNFIVHILDESGQDEDHVIKTAPTQLTGKGNDVVFVNLQSKLTRFSFKHTGESNFIVHLNEGISLANEIGNYSGSTAETLDYEGTYVISVQADGKWSIDIE
ncbi:hypothetical protein D3C71_1291770 [compost metagenome]